MNKLIILIVILVALAIYVCPSDQNTPGPETDIHEEGNENTTEKHIENPADIAEDLIF